MAFFFGLAMRGDRLRVRDMPLPAEFFEQLPSRSDAELYDILGHEGDYLPEAVAAAKEEIARRNLAPERVAELEAAEQAQVLQEQAKAEAPLGWGMRILIFLLCAGL